MNNLHTLTAITACFALSGFAALLYQTAWLRQFSVVFGTSELAIAAILAAYMGGLAFGAAIAGRVVHRLKRLILVYGVLEAAIAVTALCVPLLIAGAANGYYLLFGGQPQPVANYGLWQPTYFLITTFLIIALPTGLMGATLPILIHHSITRDEQIGPRTGLLYAMNTAGAVAGTLTAGFFLLPRLGLTQTIWVGVAVNFIVFLIATGLSGSLQKTVKQFQVTTLKPLVWKRTSWILPIVLVSGAIAFYYELLWTRLLTHIIGGSIHAFATMLASFLAGIALGGGIAGYFATSRERAITLFVSAQVAIAGFSALVYFVLQHIDPVEGGLAGNTILAIFTMLPATLFIGATFPLAVRIYSADKDSASRSSARVYTWNTFGAIVGSVAAGFYLISVLGFSGAIRLGVILNLMLALASLCLHTKPHKGIAAGLTVVVFLVIGLYFPTRPDAVITASSVSTDSSGKQLFYSVGRSATVLVLAQDDGFYLRSNGLPEAQIVRKGSPPTSLIQRWLTALPIILRPDAESLLLIGLGGGVAVEQIPARIQTIDVVELESEIVSANKTIAPLRQRDPLADPRMRIVLNDARNAMQLTNKRYNIIVSQPSHPWTGGSAHLYTAEFMRLAQEHLTEDGVFVQWMGTEFVNERLLRSLAATLTEVFKEVHLYQPSPDALIFIASATLLQRDRDLPRGIPSEFASIGINATEDLLATLSLTSSGVTKLGQGAAINTDDNNQLATTQRTFESLHNDALENVLQIPASVMAKYETGSGADTDHLNRMYLGYRLLLSGFQHRAKKFANTLELSERLTILGLDALLKGNAEQSQQFFQDALKFNQANDQARYALVRPHLTALARETAPLSIVTIADDLPPSAKAVLAGWQSALSKDWLAIQALDAILMTSKHTDTWFTEASRLRAEWRLRSAEADSGLVREAMKIVDSALALYDLESLFLLRATIALKLKDEHAFSETAAVWITVSEKQFPAERNNLIVRRQAQWFIEKLSLDFLSPVQGRADALRARFETIIATAKARENRPSR